MNDQKEPWEQWMLDLLRKPVSVPRKNKKIVENIAVRSQTIQDRISALKERGYVTKTDLYEVLGGKYEFFEGVFEKLFRKKAEFEVGGKKVPMCIECMHQSRPSMCLDIRALPELIRSGTIRDPKGIYSKMHDIPGVPRKTKGYLAYIDLLGLLGFTAVKYHTLKKLYEEKTTFEIDGQKNPAVIKMYSGNIIILCLDERALPELIKSGVLCDRKGNYSREHNLLQRSPDKGNENIAVRPETIQDRISALNEKGYATRNDLLEVLGGNQGFLEDVFKKLLQEKVEFEVGGKKVPVCVEFMHQSRPSIRLDIRALPELIRSGIIRDPKGVYSKMHGIPCMPRKTKGYLSRADLLRLLGGDDVTYTVLKKLYDEKATFEIDGQKFPMAVEMYSGKQIVICLDERALPELIRSGVLRDCKGDYSMTHDIPLQTLKKAEGHLSRTDLFKKLGGNFDGITKKMEELRVENRMFVVNGQSVPMVTERFFHGRFVNCLDARALPELIKSGVLRDFKGDYSRGHNLPLPSQSPAKRISEHAPSVFTSVAHRARGFSRTD